MTRARAQRDAAIDFVAVNDYLRCHVPSSENSPTPGWHATTILSVRKGNQVVMAGDGQVSMGQTIVKGNAKKVRRLGNGRSSAGFAGATADAFTLFERLEAKLERHPGQLLRAASSSPRTGAPTATCAGWRR